MKITPARINLFMIVNLPIAYLAGVRVKQILSQSCVTSVRFSWINKNPFKSMFWAVQGMAAELSTGALVMSKIEASGKNISMLVTQNKAEYLKKARGRINFECLNGDLIERVLHDKNSLQDGETIWMKSIGTDQQGDVVSIFEFQWSLKER